MHARCVKRFARRKMLAVGCGVLLLAQVTSRAQKLPDDAVLQREAVKQTRQSDAIIRRAEQQASRLQQPVPDLSPPARPPLPAPDPASIARRYAQAGQGRDGLYVLISLSMPAETLEQLAEQARKAGAPMILRGVADNSLQGTLERAAAIVRKHPGAEIHIDPTLFRRFRVEQVPAFIITATTDKSSCGSQCDTGNDYSLVTGDVTIEYALEYLATHSNTPYAEVARARLQKYRGAP